MMNSLNIVFVMGVWQWVIIGIAILLLFGGKKIPELMRGLGTGIKEFKDASKEDEDVQDENKNLK